MADRAELDDRAAQRIAAIAALLESPVDGEALVAARKLVSALDRHGLRIADLVHTALAPVSERSECADGAWWQTVARRCLDLEPEPGFWPLQTRNFLDSMISWRGRPSFSQQKWLRDCDALVSGERAS